MSAKPRESEKPPFSSIHSPIPIYEMTIELDKGKNDKIQIFQNSNPEELSYLFCHKNNLDFKTLTFLKEKIQSLINNYSMKKFPNTYSPETNKESTIPSRKESSNDSINKNAPNKDIQINQKEKKNSTLETKEKNLCIIRNKSFNSKINKKCSSLKSINVYNKPVAYKVILRNRKKEEYIKDYNCAKRAKNIQIRNYGELLYEKGKMQQKIKEEKINIIKEQKRLQTEENISFKPTLFTSSSNISMKRPYSQYNKKRTYDKLIKSSNTFNKFLPNKLEKKNGSTIKNKIGKIPFPNNQIEQIFKRHFPVKRRNFDFDLNRLKQTEIINNNMQILFTQRQQEFTNRTEENIIKLQNELNPRMKFNFYSNIVEKLHKCGEVHKKKKNILQKEKLLSKNNIYSSIPEDNFNLKKEKCFKSLFDILDKDKDGKISLYTMDLSQLNQEIINIINPIILDLKDYQGAINEDDFINECRRLFDKLPFQKRKLLLNHKFTN